jgi:sugar/nucleoside kinase (ribokinase family)
MSLPERKGIACGGNWIVDLVKVVDLYPTECSLANILGESIGGGGCAHNVTLNLAKFDHSVELYAVGVIGRDAYGDFLVAECRSFPNIHTGQLSRTDLEKTSYTDVFNVRATGRRTFFHQRGANRLFSPEYVDLGDLPVDRFHLGYLLLLDAMDREDPKYGTVAARFLSQLQCRGIRTSIDLVSEDSNRFYQIVPPALRYTDYCIMNDFEAEKLTGIPIRDRNTVLLSNLKRIATKLFDYGVIELVVIHFPEGAYLCVRDQQEILQPSLDLPANFIVGSTGAGDSFCAGVLYGLYQGWDYAKIMCFAVCAGGMNLRDLTTTGGMASWREILQMQEHFPFRKLDLS